MKRIQKALRQADPNHLDIILQFVFLLLHIKKIITK